MKTVENAASQIKELIQHSRAVLVIANTDSTDQVASALALADSIEKFGRNVILAAPNGPSGEAANLPGAQAFVTSIGPKSLVVAIDHPEAIAKVNYGVEGDKWNMVITPAPGLEISADQVSFSSTGRDYDLVITLGVVDLALLGQLYESEQTQLQLLPLVNLDRHPANTQFGKVNAIDPDATTLSELVYRLLSAAKLPVSPTGLELLLLGLRSGSSDFTTASAAVFEMAASITKLMQGKKESSEEKLVGEALEKIRQQAGNSEVRG